MNFPTAALILAAMAPIAGSLLAETVAQSATRLVDPEPRSMQWRFDSRSSYVFESDFKDARLGSQDALQYTASLNAALPIAEKWNLVLGGGYDCFNFSGTGTLIPDTLQGAYATIGLEYLYEGNPAVILTLQPGNYSAGTFDSGNFSMPSLLAGGYRFTDRLVGVGGVLVSSFREYRVLPMLGFTWEVSDSVRIDAVLPDAGIVFKAAEGIDLALTASITGGAYKTSDNDPLSPNDRVDYSDYRVGLGVNVTRFKPFDIQLGGGWSIRREFTYDNLDRGYRAGSEPYAQVRIQATF